MHTSRINGIPQTGYAPAMSVPSLPVPRWSSMLALLLTWGLCLTSCGFSPECVIERPLLWEVRGHGTVAHLFGTMHVADPRVTQIHPSVEAIFEQADAFYTEAGESSPTDAAKMAQAGMLPEGVKLQQLLPAETWQELDDYLRERGFGGAEQHQGYRPWFVGLTLTQLDALPLLEGGMALDFAMTRRAKLMGKEIGAIETIEEQLQALSVGSTADQAHMLGITLQNLREHADAGVSSVETLLDLYVLGDAEDIWAFAMSEFDVADPVQAAAWHALTTERNLRMVERIDARLQAAGGRREMFAFGSLHFIGPDSVVEGLRQRGYEVTRLGNP